MIELKDVTMSVSRPSGGTLNGEDEYVRIEVVDNLSRTMVMRLEVSLSDFAKMITGRSDIQIGRALYHGTDFVGKQRVSEKRRTFISKEEIANVGGAYPRKNLENWLVANKQEEGWFVDSYLGSQSSMEYDPESGGNWLNYRVHKYVDPQ